MTNSASAPVPVLGNWKEQKEKFKAKLSNLTAADLHYDDGKKDEILNTLPVKPGKTKEEFPGIISTL